MSTAPASRNAEAVTDAPAQGGGRPRTPPSPAGREGTGRGEVSTEPPRFGRRAALTVAAAFLVLALAYTAPLASRIHDALPFAAVAPEGRETAWRIQGDYLQFYYYLWLVRDRLFDGASIFRDPYQFAVDGPRSNLPNTFLPVALAYVPLSAAGPRLAYNLLVFLSFPLAGLTTALLAHRYGVGRWAALVAGAIFACAPYRVGALLGGHPAGLAYGLLPLALWGLEGALAGSLASGVWCAVALVSLAILEPHFFYFAALGLPIYLFLRAGLAGWHRDALAVRPAAWLLASAGALAAGWGTTVALARRGWTAPAGGRVAIGALAGLALLAVWQVAGGALAGLARRDWTRRAVAPLALAGLGAVGGAGFLLVLRQALLRRSVAGAGRTLHEVRLFSPDPGDLLMRVNPSAGRAIYLGGIALALATVGAIVLGRRPPDGHRRILFAFAPLLVLATALSLGPRLPGLPLFEAAFRLVPLWNFVRQPAKFQVLAALALAILAAVGAEALAGRMAVRGARAALLVLLAALVAAEYHPWRPAGVSLLPPAGPAHAAIHASGPRALYVPLWPGDSAYSALYLYTTTLTRVPMLNGYSAWIDRSYVADVYRALEPVNVGAVGEAEYAALRRYGVRQVVVDRDAFPLKVSAFGPAFTLANLRTSPFLEPARAPADDESLWIFRVREHPGDGAAVRPRSHLGIYWEAESLARETGQLAADPEASNGLVVMGRNGRDRAGFLTFGPYRLLPAGEFRALFRVRGEGSTVTLQVTADGGRRLLGAGERALGGGAFEEIPVAFGLPGPTPVEYRVNWNGAGWAAVDAVAVTFADIPDPAPAFEIEELGHELFERADRDASSGRAGYADPARTPRDAVWSGPLRRYPPGGYRLWIRLKLDRPTPAPIAWCGVQAASRGPTLGGRELLGAEVPQAGRYVELAVPFTVAQPTVVELPCVYRGGVGVWFDRLRVERLP